jgi:predicted nucleic acid-binding protein
MISLDSNIILIALDTNDSLHNQAVMALETFQNNGFRICSPVYSELRAAPNWTTVQEALRDLNVFMDWEMPQAVWEQAGIFSRR